MIRHAPEARPVGPLAVAVIETALPALLVSPVGGPPLSPARCPPASVPAVLVAPVTMRTDPERQATVGPPAKPLTQWLFAGPQSPPFRRTGQPPLRRASAILCREDVEFGSSARHKKIDRAALQRRHVRDRVAREIGPAASRARSTRSRRLGERVPGPGRLFVVRDLRGVRAPRPRGRRAVS